MTITPITPPTTQRLLMVVPAGEVVYDSTQDKYFLGDGVTMGGNEILGARYDMADASITLNKLSPGAIDYIDNSGGGGGGGVTDHGALTGLGDDDHTQYLLADGSRTLAGNLTITGTVDGRLVAVDGAKLDGIEANATADQDANEVLFSNAEWAGAGASYNASDVDAALEQLLTNKAEASHTQTLSTITDAGAMAAEADAPSDGNKYTRQNGAWATADPATVRSATQPTDTSVLWYHTTDQELYAYDSSRSKWLSVNTYEAHFGRGGAMTTNHYMRGPANFDYNTGAAVGYPMRFDATVIASWGTVASGGTSGWNHRIMKYDDSAGANSVAATYAPSGTYTRWDKQDFDLDYDQNDLLGLNLFNLGSATAVTNHTAFIAYKRRPS